MTTENTDKQLSDDETRNGILNSRYHWHQPVNLGNGIIANPKAVRRFERRLKLMKIPADLTGKTVLDIGAWDGYFSFEFERRGAKRVLAIDTFAWDKGGIDNFLLAHKRLKSKVEHLRMDVNELDPAKIGTFDIVFFAGVLYHLKNPLSALEHIHSVTKDLLICETHAMLPFTHERFPLISFFPGDENAEYPWRICAYPTVAWLRHALPAAGFKRVDFVYTPSMRWWKKLKALLINCPQTGRCIVHAHPT